MTLKEHLYLIIKVFVYSVLIISLNACNDKKTEYMNIIFLHHSTGAVIWGDPTILSRVVGKINKDIAYKFYGKNSLPAMFSKYNSDYSKTYKIREQTFPKSSPYGWHNYPFDYYNIWVKNAGNEPFMEEPTLEILTKKYQVIIFKHCFPVCNIQPDGDTVDINSDIKTISNYKLQYLALREKLNQFPETKFILFTGAAQVKQVISEDEAKRAKEFFTWVKEEWDVAGDNIFLWDLYQLQTEGGLYLLDEYAYASDNSHPNRIFADKAVRFLFNRITDVIENNGTGTELTGEIKKF